MHLLAKSMKFSIIMVSYNQYKFIEEAINSVLSQTYQNFELIILDGGSNEQTQKKLANYSHHPKVRLYVEKDKGMYHARNKGLMLANGDIIGFLNTDDYYEPKALEVIYNAITNDISVDIVFGIMHAVDINGSFIKERGFENVKLKDRIKKYDPLPDQSTFFKRSILSNLGLYNTSYKIVSDWDFWQRAIILGYNFKNIGKKIANYRHYQEALTFNPRFEKLRYKEKKRLYRNYNSQAYSKFEFNLSLRRFIIMPIKKIKLVSNIYYSIFKR